MVSESEKSTPPTIDECLSNGYFNKITGLRRVHVRFAGRQPSISPERRITIQNRWQEYLLKNPKAFSRPFLAFQGFNDYNSHTGILLLETYHSSFSEYFMTREDELEDHRIWCIGACGLTYFQEGGEKTFIFGERTPKTLQVGGDLESLPGGFVQPIPREENPLEVTLYSELGEETGFLREQVSSISPFSFGMLRKWKERHYQDTCVNYLVQLHPSVTREQVMDTFSTNTSRKQHEGKLLEHSRILLVPKRDLKRFIQEHHSNLSVRTKFTLESYLADRPFCF